MGVMRTRAYFPENCFPELQCSLRNAALGGEAEGCGRGRFWWCCMLRGSPVWRAGQMTVEFVVAFPVLIAVAVVAVNACLFFSECAAFDMVARDGGAHVCYVACVRGGRFRERGDFRRAGKELLA